MRPEKIAQPFGNQQETNTKFPRFYHTGWYYSSAQEEGLQWLGSERRQGGGGAELTLNTTRSQEKGREWHQKA